jgi:FtsK/SpoIIIE family
MLNRQIDPRFTPHRQTLTQQQILSWAGFTASLLSLGLVAATSKAPNKILYSVAAIGAGGYAVAARHEARVSQQALRIVFENWLQGLSESASQQFAPVGDQPISEATLIDGGSGLALPSGDDNASNTAVALQQAVFDLGHPCDFVGAVQGSSLVEIRLKPQDVSRLSNLLRVGEQLQVLMGLPIPPIITPAAGSVAFTLPREDRQFPSYLDHVKSVSSDSNPRMVIGVDVRNRLVEIELKAKELESSVTGGMPGSGKSYLIMVQVASLARSNPSKIGFVFFDGKGGVTLNPIAKRIPNYIHGAYQVAVDAEQAAEQLEWCVEELASRYGLMSGLGVDNLDDYNRKAKKPLPFLPIFADECQYFIDKKDEANRKLWEDLASKGRAAGMPLFLYTQRPDGNSVPEQINRKCATRLCMRVDSEKDSKYVIGQSGGEHLLPKGDLLYKGQGGKAVRLQGLGSAHESLEDVLNELFSLIPGNVPAWFRQTIGGLPELPGESPRNPVERSDSCREIDGDIESRAIEPSLVKSFGFVGAKSQSKAPKIDADRVRNLAGMGLNQKQIIYAIWGKKPGEGSGYQSAREEYLKIMGESESE